MKYLIILLLSFNLYAQTDIEIEEARLQVIRDQLAVIGIVGNTSQSQEVIAKLLKKCSIVYNSAFFYERLFRVENADKLTCFLDKKIEVEQDDIDREDKRNERAARRGTMSDYDCNTIVAPNLDYLKLLCESRK